MKQRYILAHDEARRRALNAVQQAPDGYVVDVREPTRSLDQNSALWPRLEAFSKQLQWPVNGALCYLEPSDWKTILSAAFRKEQARLSPGLDGGVVWLGASTSRMGKWQFSMFLDFIDSVAAERGVKLHEHAA